MQHACVDKFAGSQFLIECRYSVPNLQVLYCKDNLAIVSGLNSDAPVGTKLSFVTGGVG